MSIVDTTPLGPSKTANGIIDDVLNKFLSGTDDEINKLALPADPGATSLVLTYDLEGIQRGSRIEIDFETYRVWSADATTKTVVVQPGMNGTTSVAHTAGTLVYVNPRLTRGQIMQAINEELLTLSAPSNGLYSMKATEFDFNATVTDYELPEDVMEVHSVYIEDFTGTQEWMRLDIWDANLGADVTTFPSGHSVHVATGYPGRKVRVIYKAAFTPLSLPTDDVYAVSGMPTEMQDILTLGALLRLGPVREIRRNFTESQGDTRRSEEVAAGNVTNSFSYVRKQYEARIDYEAQRLAVRYPLLHR